MTRSAHIYAWTVIAIGMAVLGCAALEWQSSWQSATGAVTVACLGLAAVAATFKVKLPKLTGTISPAFVFVLVATADLSWSETVGVSVVSALVQCLLRPATRPTTLQLAFNAATMAIAGGVAHGVARGLTAFGGSDVLVVVLGAAGVALLVTNTLLVATILCLMEEGPFYKVWRSVQLWAVPYYLGGGILAGVWSRADLRVSAKVTVLAAASVYMLSVCYQELVLLCGRREAAANIP
jgi:hypothetical protein